MNKEYDTGAVREVDPNKVDLTLLPWECFERLARHYMNGANKYSRDNWKKGIPNERYKEALLRHVSSVILGETNEDHLSAIIFNAFGLMYNDIPKMIKYDKVEAAK